MLAHTDVQYLLEDLKCSCQLLVVTIPLQVKLCYECLGWKYSLIDMYQLEVSGNQSSCQQKKCWILERYVVVGSYCTDSGEYD